MAESYSHAPAALKGDRRAERHTGRCCQGACRSITRSEHAKSKKNRRLIPAHMHEPRSCPHAAAMTGPLPAGSACWGCSSFGLAAGAAIWTRRDRSGCSVRSMRFRTKVDEHILGSLHCAWSRRHRLLGCCAMAVFVLSCYSAFGGNTEGSEKLQKTANIADGGSHRRMGCVTHPASFQRVIEPSTINRAAVVRVPCAR